TERRHAARRENHVDVDAFEIHVAHPRVRIDADALARERGTLPADVPGSATILRAPCRRGRRLDALPRAKAAVQRWPLADQVARYARLGGRAPDQRAERGQRRPLRPREGFLAGLNRLAYGRVRGGGAV